MFTAETLSGQERQKRTTGTDAERNSIANTAIKLKLFIYKKEIHNSIVKMLNTGKGKIASTIGRIAGEIMVKFEKDAGYINDPDVLEGLSQMLVKEIISIAVAGELISEDQLTPELIGSIVGVAQQFWDKNNPSRVDKGRAERMMTEGQNDPNMQKAVAENAQNNASRQIGQRPSDMQAQPPQQQPVARPTEQGMAPQAQMPPGAG